MNPPRSGGLTGQPTPGLALSASLFQIDHLSSGCCPLALQFSDFATSRVSSHISLGVVGSLALIRILGTFEGVLCSRRCSLLPGPHCSLHALRDRTMAHSAACFRAVTHSGEADPSLQRDALESSAAVCKEHCFHLHCWLSADSTSL